MRGVAAQIFACWRTRIDIADAFVIGDKIDTFANPARRGQVTLQAQQGTKLAITGNIAPQAAGSAAPVAFPARWLANVAPNNYTALRPKSNSIGHAIGQGGRQSSLRGQCANRPAIVIEMTGTGGKKNMLALRVPASNQARAGLKGQAPRFISQARHEIDLFGSLGFSHKGQLLAIGRKPGRFYLRHSSGQPLSTSPCICYQPEVIFGNKDNRILM